VETEHWSLTLHPTPMPPIWHCGSAPPLNPELSHDQQRRQNRAAEDALVGLGLACLNPFSDIGIRTQPESASRDMPHLAIQLTIRQVAIIHNS
jgi:hypothetical protein